MNGYDLRKSVTDKALRERKGLRAWIASEEAKGNVPHIPEEVLQNTEKTHYKTIPMNEFVAMVDAVSSLEHTGRIKGMLIAGREKKDLEDTVSGMVATNYKNNKDKALKKLRGRISLGNPADQSPKWYRGAFAEHRKVANIMREMDGYDEDGTWWNAIVRPMNEQADWEAVRTAEENVRLGKLFGTYSSTEFIESVPLVGEAISEAVLPDNRLYHRRLYPNIPNWKADEPGIRLSKSEILVLAMNWGNADNRLRVKDGFGFEDEHVEELLDTLDARDWKFVQDTWDYLDSFWEEIAAKEKRVFGVAPDKVTALPVINKFGTFRGGYFPISFSKDLDADSFQQAKAAQAANAKAGAFGHATTARGHTKARMESAGEKPINLSFDTIFSHVTNVVHDLAWHENLRNVNKILDDTTVKSSILSNQGVGTYNAIISAIEDIAAGDVQGMKFHEKAFNYLRAGASISAMGWNLGTALLQPFGITQGMQRVGAVWVAKSLLKGWTGAVGIGDTADQMMAESAFMRMRALTINREVNEIRNKVGTTGFTGKLAAPLSNSFFSMIVKAQLLADMPIWLGAKEKALSGGFNLPTAIAMADQAVIDSQGSGHIKDLAGVQRGNPVKKLFTNFMSYFQTTFNLTVDSFTRTKFSKAEDIFRLGSDLFMLYTAPIILSWTFREALIKGQCDHGADVVCSTKAMAREHISYAMGGILGIRELNSIVSGFYGYSGPAGTRFFSEAGRLAQQVAQGEADVKLGKAALRTGGVLFHFPAGQVEKVLIGYMELQDGTTKNLLTPIFGRDRSND